jgi:hypothetical protein
MLKASRDVPMEKGNKGRQHAGDVRRNVRYRSPTGRANCCTEREEEVRLKRHNV